MRLPDPKLLLVTDRRQARLSLPAIAAAAFTAGCRWLSVREKDLSDDDQIALARTLLPLARRHGAALMMHGEAALAEAAGADGVHLPAGRNAADARAMLGRDKLIGLSIHTVTEAAVLDPDTVDYAIAGPAYETASKPGYGPEIGKIGLGEIARVSRVPVLAIGGVNAARVAELLALGIAGVAVMGGVMRAADPAREVKALLTTLAGMRFQPRPR